MPSGSGDGTVRGAAAELVTKHSLRARIAGEWDKGLSTAGTDGGVRGLSCSQALIRAGEVKLALLPSQPTQQDRPVLGLLRIHHLRGKSSHGHSS